MSEVYSDRYVAFIDILGFGERVLQSKTDPSLGSEILKALSAVAESNNWGQAISGADLRAQSFSDSVILSTLPSALGLEELLSSITALANALLVQSSLLIRGGVSRGLVRHDQNVAFGPAIIDAYRIEKEIAKFPRVVIGKAAYADAIALRPAVGAYFTGPVVVHYRDGAPFLDIFSKFDLRRGGPEELLIPFAEVITECLQKLMDESIHEPKHFEKVCWLVDYWNGKCSESVGRFKPVLYPWITLR